MGKGHAGYILLVFIRTASRFGTSFIFDIHPTPRPSCLAWNPYPPLNQRRIFKNCFISAHFQTEGDTIYDTLYTTWLSTAKETKVKTYLHSYLPSYIPTYRPTYIPTYLATYLPTYLPNYLQTYLFRWRHWYWKVWPRVLPSCPVTMYLITV